MPRQIERSPVGLAKRSALQRQLRQACLKRFHGTVALDPTRVRIADEVIAHLVGLMGSEVTVTLEIEAKIPSGVPNSVVRTVTENGRTLKFTSQGFEQE